METLLLIWYPKCSTCRKAKAWLDEKGVDYVLRDIVENSPTRDELKLWYDENDLDIKKFFNTSGQLYRNLDLKNKLELLTEEEKIGLLAMDGMLVKRPVLVKGNKILLGFNEEKWTNLLG